MKIFEWLYKFIFNLLQLYVHTDVKKNAENGWKFYKMTIKCGQSETEHLHHFLD